MTSPRVGPVRSPMIRSSVDLPQPDGPISETNSPWAMSSEMPSSAVVAGWAPRANTWSTLERRTTGWSVMRAGLLVRRLGGSAGLWPAAVAKDVPLDGDDQQEEENPEQGGAADRRPELLRAGDVVLVERDDQPAQAFGDPARPLADDRPDDPRRRGDLQRREEVRQRRRQAQLPVDLGARRRVRPHQLHRPRVERPQAPDHRDRHGEEREVGRDDHDRDDVRPEREHDHRGEGDDRDGLA